jgi:hypothetical protein
MRTLTPALVLCSVVLSAACRPPLTTAPNNPPGDTVPDDSGSGPTDTGGTEQIGEAEAPRFEFSPDRIGHVSISLSAAAINALYADPFTYVEGSVTVDDDAIDLVGVRLRGKYGSFRELSGKPKFKIDFNRYVDGQRYGGLEALSLNNALVDCSSMKEILAAEVFAGTEVIASRAMYMTVDVNGDDYGLYVLVETQDDRFLDRYWEDDSGNLYDGKYWMDENWNYVLLDFGDRVDDYFQLEEGVDVDNADIRQISAMYTATQGSDAFYTTSTELLEWPTLHRMWAASQWLGQNDGYCLNRNNYRVYFDPQDDKAEMIPTDLDYSFLHASEWGYSWNSPNGNLAAACLANEACRADWRDTVAEVLGIIDEMPLTDRAEQAWTLIEQSVHDDPRRECSFGDAISERDELYQWILARSARLRSHWGL